MGERTRGSSCPALLLTNPPTLAAPPSAGCSPVKRVSCTWPGCSEGCSLCACRLGGGRHSGAQPLLPVNDVGTGPTGRFQESQRPPSRHVLTRPLKRSPHLPAPAFSNLCLLPSLVLGPSLGSSGHCVGWWVLFAPVFSRAYPSLSLALPPEK